MGKGSCMSEFNKERQEIKERKIMWGKRRDKNVGTEKLVKFSVTLFQRFVRPIPALFEALE